MGIGKGILCYGHCSVVNATDMSGNANVKWFFSVCALTSGHELKGWGKGGGKGTEFFSV